MLICFWFLLSWTVFLLSSSSHASPGFTELTPLITNVGIYEPFLTNFHTLAPCDSRNIFILFFLPGVIMFTSKAWKSIYVATFSEEHLCGRHFYPDIGNISLIPIVTMVWNIYHEHLKWYKINCNETFKLYHLAWLLAWLVSS